ncbi:MAG: Ig-like domain-containing protein [Nitrospirae bacterium]|nr:Ig-like domain-containing protein [Nitrospirota bacterium]
MKKGLLSLTMFLVVSLLSGFAYAVQMGGSIQGTPLTLTSANAVVTTLAGSGSIGATDATGTSASFYRPQGITTDGTNLFVTDLYNHKIRQIVISTGVVTTLAGSGTAGSTDATGTSASFNYPYEITTDGTNLFVADTYNHKIRKIVISTGVVTTLAGSGTAGSTDATGTSASFNYPSGITTDGTNLFVADGNNNKIRQIVISTGVVTTLAGSGTAGSTDATGTSASFNRPFGVTTDGTNLYVADYNNNKIRKIVISNGIVTTLAGSGTAGSTDATGTAASFYNPIGVTTDGTNLFVAEYGNHIIRKIVISTSDVTTIAGSAGSSGSTDATGTAASFYNPTGITTDGTNLFVADYNNHKIRQISPGADTTAPTVSSTSPTSGATGVTINGNVTVTWSENVDCTTVNTTNITIDGGGWTLSNCEGNQAIFTTSGQAYSTAYTVTVSTAVKDVAGNNMSANYAWSYTTEAAPSYSITLVLGTGGNISCSPNPVNSGSTSTCTVTPDTGYSISSVTGCGGSLSSNTYTTGSITSNCTVAASFAIKTYTITASAGSGGSISPSGGVTVNHGSSQAFTISPDSDYSISNVTVDGSSVGAVSSYTFSTVTANHTISASFASTYSPPPIVYNLTLTVNTAGNGNGTISVNYTNYGTSYSGTCFENQNMTLTANPSSDSTFTGWSGDCSGTGTTINVIMSSSKTCTATFTLKTHTITASAGSGGSISPSGSVTVNQGSSQTFTITPDTNYSISDVTVDGASVGAVSSYVFGNVTANHTITASFGYSPSSHSLTIMKSGTGTGTVTSSTGTLTWDNNTCTIMCAAHESITLTATADDGSTFGGWSGCDSASENTCTVAMGSDANVAAEFIKASDIALTLTPPSNTTVSKGSKLGPFSISIKNNTSSNYPFYAYVYVVNPDGTWKNLISKSLTLSAGEALTANNLYMNIPSAISTGTYSYWVGIYDANYNLLDSDSFAFTVTSSTSKSELQHDWNIAGW